MKINLKNLFWGLSGLTGAIAMYSEHGFYTGTFFVSGYFAVTTFLYALNDI